MQTLSLRALLRTLSLSLFVVVGLSVVGCDSGGSNGGSPNWVGNWKDSEGKIALSLSKDEVKEAEVFNGFCRVFESNVTNINGNTITVQKDDGPAEFTIEEASNGELTFSSTEFDGRQTLQSADDNKTVKQILECS